MYLFISTYLCPSFSFSQRLSIPSLSFPSRPFFYSFFISLFLSTFYFFSSSFSPTLFCNFSSLSFCRFFCILVQFFLFSLLFSLRSFTSFFSFISFLLQLISNCQYFISLCIRIYLFLSFSFDLIPFLFSFDLFWFISKFPSYFSFF